VIAYARRPSFAARASRVAAPAAIR